MARKYRIAGGKHAHIFGDIAVNEPCCGLVESAVEKVCVLIRTLMAPPVSRIQSIIVMQFHISDLKPVRTVIIRRAEPDLKPVVGIFGNIVVEFNIFKDHVLAARSAAPLRCPTAVIYLCGKTVMDPEVAAI